MKIKLNVSQYKRLLSEMRHDGKSTGLFADEEPKVVNEFGKKMKSYVNDKSEELKNSWKTFVSVAKREKGETMELLKVLQKLVSGKEVTENEIKLLKAQSKDIVKIVAVMGMGAVSMAIPLLLEKVLNKYGISIMPSSHKELGDEESVEEINEGKKKKNKLCARGISAAKSRYDVYPSAYSIGHGVQVCTGAIRGLDGQKRCSGSYCSGKKNESYNFDDIEVAERLDEDLAVWFGTKKKGKGTKQPQGPWVNICRKKEGGGHPECGRGDSDKGGYPVCRAKSVAANMSQESKDSACRRKREKEKNDGKSGKGQSPSPIKIKNYKKSKKNESLNYDRMLITENRTIISEGLRYHIDNEIPLTESVYRYGSESFFNLINEVRELHTKGKIDLSFSDEEIIRTDIGKQGIYEGRKVWLDIPNEYMEINEAEYKGKTVELSKPKRGGSKKFYVYVMCNGKVKKVSFGAKSGGGNLAVKLRDPKARKAFADRHNCPQKNDKCSAGYWSCRLPRYAKQLGLSGGGTWW